MRIFATSSYRSKFNFGVEVQNYKSMILTMKAIILKRFGGVENFELAEVEIPKVEKGDVLIKTRATAFNPIDYQMRKGLSESKLLKSFILGREFSGEIVELGSDVEGFAIGDRVAAYAGNLGSNGTYAEYLTVPFKILAKMPTSLSFEQAAALPLVGLTALQCLNRVNIPKESSIFIAGGAGGVGSMLIKLLLSNGNKNIYTTAGNNDSIRQLRNIGLGEGNIIDYKKANVVDQAKSFCSHFTFVIDLVGGYMSEVCAELIDVFGTYVDVAFLGTEKAKELLFDKATTIVNVANYAMASKGPGHFEDYGKMLTDLFNRLEKGLIAPPEIDVIGALHIETAQMAHRILENNETKGRKLVMKVN